MKRKPPRAAARFVVLCLANSALGFLGWCTMDFAYVRHASKVSDALLLLLPLLFSLAGIFVFRKHTPARIFLLVVFEVTISLFLTFAWVLTAGMSFHFRIGGTL